jgi:hypothetical protein
VGGIKTRDADAACAMTSQTIHKPTPPRSRCALCFRLLLGDELSSLLSYPSHFCGEGRPQRQRRPGWGDVTITLRGTPPTRHLVRSAHEVPPKSELRSSRPTASREEGQRPLVSTPTKTGNASSPRKQSPSRKRCRMHRALSHREFSLRSCPPSHGLSAAGNAGPRPWYGRRVRTLPAKLHLPAG